MTLPKRKVASDKYGFKHQLACLEPHVHTSFAFDFAFDDLFLSMAFPLPFFVRLLSRSPNIEKSESESIKSSPIRRPTGAMTYIIQQGRIRAVR